MKRTLNPSASPDLSQELDEVEEVEEVEDEYEGDDDEQEQFEVQDEDVIDEEVEGKGDIEADEKPEGLDLDMADEDGVGYQDDGQDDELDGMEYHNELNDEGEAEGPQIRELDCRAGEGAESKFLGDIKAKASVKEVATTGKEDPEPTEEKPHVKFEESKDDPLSRPEHGSEVFVGNISKDTMEDELRDLCASCGDIFEVRVMRDKDKGDNANKGFAFVTFTNKESAQKAIGTLNDIDFKGRKLRFSSSQLKNKLFIGNVPKIWDKEELEKVLSERGPGMQNIELLKDPQNPERNRGFAFVEYYNHGCAEHARRMLSLPGFKLGPNTPTINWADSPSGLDHTASSQVKVVYVRNLPESATQENVWKLFERHGEITKVMLPQSRPGQVKRDFGFIHFAERSSALKAIEKTEKYVLDGRELETNLAKPPADKRPGVMGTHASVGAGILPQAFQTRGGFGFPGHDMDGGVMALGLHSGRAFRQVQPVIYGRGPAPAGMTMVPMMLPDGRIGYVLQQAEAVLPAVASYTSAAGGSSRRDDRNDDRGQHSQRHSSGGNSRRYHPY